MNEESKHIDFQISSVRNNVQCIFCQAKLAKIKLSQGDIQSSLEAVEKLERQAHLLVEEFNDLRSTGRQRAAG